MSKFKVTVHYDQDCESPNDRNPGYDFNLHSFGSRHSNFKHPSELGLGPIDRGSGEPKITSPGLRSKLKHSTAWLCSYFEHGQCVWFLKGDHVPGVEFQWDGVRVAGLLVWQGKPSDLSGDPAVRDEQARVFLKEYTDWCNGQCFYYSIENEAGEHIDSCGGYIGADWAKQAVVEALVLAGCVPDDDIEFDGEASWAVDELELPAPKAVAGV